MRLKRLRTIAVALVWTVGACSGAKPNQNDKISGCAGLAVEICRELTPGEFKLDTVGFCSGQNRTPEENEVPMSYCQSCLDERAAIQAEMAAIAASAVACEKSEDCAVIAVTPSCAFGCGVVYRRHFDPSRFNELAASSNRCAVCERSCEHFVADASPVCKQGRCVAYRQSSSQ